VASNRIVTSLTLEVARTWQSARADPSTASGASNDLEAAVGAARRGDQRAFEALYHEHVGRVHALARRLAFDPGRADELTQDVFVRAWERLATFRGESTFGTWLHRLAVNTILSDRRARWRRRQRIEADGGVAEGRAAVPPAPVGTRIDLDAAIASLPPGARAVFVLHDVEGYQHQDIARLTGIAIGTSKAQLFRARRLLREVLA
jgi:RNA polymerase sigma-70 factor (ECF subfamily)